MAPGFALVLISVVLAVIAPVIFIVSVVSCFSTSRRPQAIRWLLSGFVGGIVAIASFSLLTTLLAPSQPQVEHEAFLVLFGAGFSAFAILRGVFPLLLNLWRQGNSHA